MTRRTKKTPTAQSLAAHATSRPDETPKGSGPSVAPSREESGRFRSTACALVSSSALCAFLAARGGVLAPGGPSLEATAAGLLFAPSTALYVADGEERPLADELLEIPAFLRLADASRVSSEAA